MLSLLLSTLSFALVIAPIIIVHEFGHFLAGKWLGAKPEVFSLGFGPPLFSFRFLGAEFRVAPIPLGGFVSFEKVQFVYERELVGKEDAAPLAAWKWVLITLAGPLSNFVLTFALAAGMLYHDLTLVSVHTLPEKITLYKFEHPAQSLLLKQVCGDTCPEAIRYHEGVYVALVPGSLVALGVTGPGRPLTLMEKSLYSVLIAGQAMQTLVSSTSLGIQQMFSSSDGYRALSGPVGIASMSKDATQNGLGSFLFLAGIISFSVGFFNLLPLSILDGGRAALGLCEMVLRKPIAKAFAVPFQLVSLTLVGILFLAGFASDLAQMFRF